MLRELLGLPCPTTGLTRSLLSLLQGHFSASLLWNPFTVPILLLLLVSTHKLALAALRKKELVLPNWMWPAWWITLALAWGAKFVLGRAYW